MNQRSINTHKTHHKLSNHTPNDFGNDSLANPRCAHKSLGHTQLIAQRFSRAYQTYNDHASIQALMARRLIDVLPPFHHPINAVCEIGAGTGNLTCTLLERHRVDNLYLNDLYPPIQAQHLGKNVHHCEYLIGDIFDKIDLIKTPLNLIISNAALQWIYPLDELLKKLFDALTETGYLAFSSFSNQNLIEIKKLTNIGLNYYTLDDLCALMTAIGFKLYWCDEQIHQLFFNHPMAVLKHLKATGVSAINSEFRWNKQRLNDFFAHYPKTADDTHPLTYHPIYIIAAK